jgi:hypothetical protein
MRFDNFSLSDGEERIRDFVGTLINNLLKKDALRALGPNSQKILRQILKILVTLRWICEAITHKK